MSRLQKTSRAFWFASNMMCATGGGSMFHPRFLHTKRGWYKIQLASDSTLSSVTTSFPFQVVSPVSAIVVGFQRHHVDID